MYQFFYFFFFNQKILYHEFSFFCHFVGKKITPPPKKKTGLGGVEQPRPPSSIYHAPKVARMVGKQLDPHWARLHTCPLDEHGPLQKKTKTKKKTNKTKKTSYSFLSSSLYSPLVRGGGEGQGGGRRRERSGWRPTARMLR